MKMVRALLAPAVIAAVLWGLWSLFPHGNPGGVSDAKYSKFKSSAAPKLLYSCTRAPTRESFLKEFQACNRTGRARCEEEVNRLVATGIQTVVGFAAGAGKSTYDELLRNAKDECRQSLPNMGPGEFKVVEADEG